MDSIVWLSFLLLVEVLGRIVLEVRECRLTQQGGGFWMVLRIIPLVNDLVPLPENRREPVVGNFVKLHEEGHQKLHHATLRNTLKVLLLLLALGWIVFVTFQFACPLWEAFLWLHVVAIPGRMLFHGFCWNQEYEADTYAFRQLEKKIAKNALRELTACEIPHTKLFALIYREHPTAALRQKKLHLK
ncbi:hypothetical protein SAMN05720468_11030 [Fibrobacter sp. UWEL]|nr:hypothetical protein SAMN05720468_11030 [Fibrobacter sp. UWEL]